MKLNLPRTLIGILCMKSSITSASSRMIVNGDESKGVLT